MRAGHIEAAAAAGHPMAHVLTQAVGVEAPPRPDVELHTLHTGDVLLLCSDGLTGPVDDGVIETILRDAEEAREIEQAPGRLVEAALARGGPDNVTAVVVQVGD